MQELDNVEFLDQRVGQAHEGAGQQALTARRAVPLVTVARVRRWLAKPENQRVTLHFTPAGCSWLNMVEIFFGIITRQAIRRGTFRCVKDLTTAIGRFIDACNDRCHPFSWTKDAGELLAKIRPSKS